jgi:hypothetical protein
MVVVAAKDSTGRAANTFDAAAEGEIELEDAAPPLGAS